MLLIFQINFSIYLLQLTKHSATKLIHSFSIIFRVPLHFQHYIPIIDELLRLL